MKMEDVTLLSGGKGTAWHILINAFIWGDFSSCCSTLTETLSLLDDGDLHSPSCLLISGRAMWQVHVCVCARSLSTLYMYRREYRVCARCTKLGAALVFELRHKHLETLINVYASTHSYVVKNKCQSSLFQTCFDSMRVSVWLTAVFLLCSRGLVFLSNSRWSGSMM